MKELNTALGIFGSKFTKRPFYLRFHVTHRCNYRCRMCNQRQSEDPLAELSLEQIRRMARSAADLGARHVVITGGEPFLRPDLPGVIAAFNACNFSVRVQTNGGPQVTAVILSECARAGLQDLSVSVDTLNRPVQDEICQARNVVDNALRTLRIAREVLPHSISQANIVASRFNFEEIPALVKYFHDMGSYSYVTPVMILTDGNQRPDRYKFRSEDTDFRPETLPADVHNRILDQLIALRKRGGADQFHAISEGLPRLSRNGPDRLALRGGNIVSGYSARRQREHLQGKACSGKHSRSRFQEVFPKPRLRETHSGADRFLHRMFLRRVSGTAVRGPGPFGPCRMGA